MLTELDELDSSSGWVPFFQKLSWISRENAGSQRIAKTPENRLLNRYRDVLPYDHSRVVLKDGETDYINANLVEVPSVNRRYILTQGPLKSTSAHFWQMVWEQNSKAIIMLNRIIEKNQIKCSQYWPCGAKIGHTDVLQFGIFRIVYIEENMSDFFTVRTLELFNMKENEKRKILHFHYLHWPDFGVPTSPATFLSFLLEARNAGVLSEDVGPSIIHCSAGIGRSGTYIMVDTILKQVEKTRDLNGVDMTKTLTDIRRYRVGLIQTPDQLRFTYAAILEGTHMLFPEVYEEALDKFMEERDRKEKEGSEEEETPPPVPARKRHDVDKTVDKEANIAPKRKRSLPDIPSEGPSSVAETPKEMPATATPDTSKGVSSYQGFQAQNISSEESDGEDEIIDLSASSSSSSSVSAREPEDDINIIKGKEEPIREQENVEYPKEKVEQSVEVKEDGDNVKRKNREITETLSAREPEDDNIIKGKEEPIREQENVEYLKEKGIQWVEVKEDDDNIKRKKREITETLSAKEEPIREQENVQYPKEKVEQSVEVKEDGDNIKRKNREITETLSAREPEDDNIIKGKEEPIHEQENVEYPKEKVVQWVEVKEDDDNIKRKNREITKGANLKMEDRKEQTRPEVSKKEAGNVTLGKERDLATDKTKEQNNRMDETREPVSDIDKDKRVLKKIADESAQKFKAKDVEDVDMERSKLEIQKTDTGRQNVEEKAIQTPKMDDDHNMEEPNNEIEESTKKSQETELISKESIGIQTCDLDTEQIMVILGEEDNKKMEGKEKPSKELEDATEKSKEQELISKGINTMETELDLAKEEVVRESVEEASLVKQKSDSVWEKDVDKSENLSKTETKPTRPLAEVTRTTVTGPALAFEKMKAIKVKQAIIPEPAPKPMEIESSESAVLESAPGAYARIVNAEKIKRIKGEPSAESIGGSIGTNPRKSDHTVHSKVQDSARKFTQEKAAGDDTQPGTSKESIAELRRRQRQEKKEKTAKLVSDIKAKVKHEENTRWIKKFVKNSLIVIGVCAIAYFAFRCYRYFYPLQRRKFRRFPL